MFQEFGFIFKNSRVIPSFRPRFAGNCDRQSRYLTQFTSVITITTSVITSVISNSLMLS